MKDSRKARLLTDDVQRNHSDVAGLNVPNTAIWMVCFIVFIDSLGGSISGPVLPFYARLFHASNTQLGILFSAFSFAQVIFLPIFGALSDHFGRRTVLVMSLFGAAIGAFGQGLARSFSSLVVARIISGACGAVGSTANVYVSDITSEDSRGQYLGYLMSSNGAAFAFGPGLGGGLSRFGLNVPVQVNGVLCIVAGLLAYVYLPESPVFLRKQRELAKAESASDKSLKVPIPLAVWAICFVEFLRGFSFSAIYAMFGLFALEVYGFDSLHTGYTVCVGALVLISTNVWITTPLIFFAGQMGSATLGMVIIAGGEMTLAFAPSLTSSLLGTWSVYMGQAIAGCNIAAITSTFASDENRGTVMSMQQMAQAIGRVVGPLCLGHLSDINPRWPFALAASTAVLAGFVLSALTKHHRKQLVIQPLGPSPIFLPSPPPWAPESYSEEDVEEFGRFLCNLLQEGRYRWHKPDQREALKEHLRICFPPLSTEDVAAGAYYVSNVQKVGVTDITGDESSYLRSPAPFRAVSMRTMSTKSRGAASIDEDWESRRW